MSTRACALALVGSVACIGLERPRVTHDATLDASIVEIVTDASATLDVTLEDRVDEFVVDVAIDAPRDRADEVLDAGLDVVDASNTTLDVSDVRLDAGEVFDASDVAEMPVIVDVADVGDVAFDVVTEPASDVARDAVDDVPVRPDVTSCEIGLTRCEGARACIDTRSNNANCGACGHACPASQSCLLGLCVSLCLPPRTRCGAMCVDTQSDDHHCGRCNHGCGRERACVDGVCVSR